MEKIKKSRSKITMEQHGITDATNTVYPGVYHGFNDQWSVKKFKRKLKVKVVKYGDMEMEFDIVGADASLVNAFRRILIAEVPSMGIEKALVYNNTSIIQDEVLAHRLGLIPLKADARIFEYVHDEDTVGTEQDTLQYELKLKCSWNPARKPDSNDPDEMYINHKVYSSHIRWIPLGTQAELYTATDVGPVDPHILIAKLRPGHVLDMRLHAVKSDGDDHAKFSPVATAFYRLLPQITLTREVTGEQAERLQSCFSPGVIKLVEQKGRKKAVVENARYDSCSRNVFRYDDLADAVTLGRVKDHFIFNVESVGALTPDTLVFESIKILKWKCRKFLAEINRGLED